MSTDAPPRRASAPRRLGPVLVVGVLLGAAVAVGLTLLVSGDAAAALGLPDPGPLTRAGLPAVRVLAECAAVVAVGSLLLAAFLVPPQRSGTLAADGYAALRTAGLAAAMWALASALMVPLTTADALGRPVRDTLSLPVLAELVGLLPQTGAWALTAGIALVVAAGCWAVLSWGWTVALFGAAVLGLLPVAVTGHSSAGGAHDVATNSLIYHLLAAALWVGGLVAVLAHLARGRAHAGLAASRFSRLALVCWLVLAGSGVVNALVRIVPSDLLTTGYGRMVLGKITALVVLGALGALQRRGAVAAVAERGDRASMLRLGAVEVLVMFATIGLAAALSRTPPPSEAAAPPSRTEVLIGYDLAGPPTLARLLLDWRFDLVFGVLALVAAGLYLAAVRRLRRRGDRWPVGRTVAWLAGCAVVLVATSSGIGRYSPAMFSMHMGTHMLLSMLAPALLVLGGAVTLALRALPPAGAEGPPGPREWLLAAVHSTPARVLTHPLVALALFVGSFYALYFSGLFEAALYSHWAHLAMNAHFLLVGYVFYWPIVGVDPAPHRLPPLGRLGLLFASVPFHAFFGITLMSSATPIGESFYSALALPFVPDLLADQRLGGGLAWAAGELPLLMVLVALLVQWSRSDERAARRADRRADADGDAELAAYNAMLARLAERDAPRR